MSDVVARVTRALADREWNVVRAVLHPYVHWHDASGERLRGRTNVLAFLETAPPPAQPSSYELRDGQIYRWSA